MLKISCSLFSTVIFALLCAPLIASAGGYVELPRSFGQLEIGMSQNAFTEITGVIPELCAVCIKKETFASLSEKQLVELDADSDGADVFFYDKKLYLISVGTRSRDLTTLKEDFEQIFGGPGVKILEYGNVEKLKWEDELSVITINYHKKNKNVFSVNYYDWELKQERDWRESQIQEKEKILTKKNNGPKIINATNILP